MSDWKVPFLSLEQIHRSIAEDLKSAAGRVVDSGWYVLGNEVEEFEDEYSELCGAKHAVGVASGLDAIEIALRAAGVKAGDEVIVPAQTFIATWLAVSRVGASVVSVDVDSADCNLSVSRTRDAINENTAAVVGVDMFGNPCAMRELRELCDDANIVFIQDAAQSHAATQGDDVVGSVAHLTTFSFYPGKNLGALGDGGILTTNDCELANVAREIRNYGSRKKYDHVRFGMNSRLDEIQAAMLRVKLKHLGAWTAQRREQAAYYRARLAETPGIQLLGVRDDTQPAWHLFPVRVSDPDLVIGKLAEAGIQALRHYPVRPGLSGAYRDAVSEPSVPCADIWARCEVSLPIGPHLAFADIELVAEVLHRILQEENDR